MNEKVFCAFRFYEDYVVEILIRRLGDKYPSLILKLPIHKKGMYIDFTFPKVSNAAMWAVVDKLPRR